MQLVERHRIDRHDARFVAIDAAAFASKNLYNAALYITRQAFIFEGKRIAYEALARQLQGTERYRTLPAKVAQWVLKQVTRAWDSFFLALTAWKADPASFLGRPRFPKYLDKNGRNLLIYTIQAISRQALRRGIIQPSGLSIRIQTNQTAVRQVRIIPRGTHYMIEIVYEQPINPASLDSSLFAAVNIGLNNLAALTSNKPGFQPCLINGRPLKTVNQWYNKRRAYLQARLSQKRQSSRQLDALTDKRNRRITDYLHNASRALINVLIREKIGSLVIGKNEGWKQHIRLGARTNQNFVQIPHARFIAMLTYKAQLVGIRVIVREESYTSKVSFLDNEPVEKHDQYVGRRIHRGLFRTAIGQHINADVNGAYNILVKAAPDAFVRGRSGCVVQPVRLALPNRAIASYNVIDLDTIP